MFYAIQVVSIKVHLDSKILSMEAQTSNIHQQWLGPYNSTSDARALLFKYIDVFQLDVRYDTYRERCVALVFLDDVNEWDLVMSDSAAYYMSSRMRNTFVILLVFNEFGHSVGLFHNYWREMGEDFVHRLSSEEHPLSDEHLMVLVLVDITMRLEAGNINVKAFNLPMSSEEETREVEEIDRRARSRRLPTVMRLQLYGDLEHS
jgi:hypothetical protein